MTSISRRHFVVSTLGGLGVAAVSTRSARSGQGPSAPAIATAAAAESGWFDRPMRWAQLTLVENDPGRFDPALWLDSLTRIHADAACLSAGGVVVYYPTKIPRSHGRLSKARHGRHRADRSACGAPGCLRRASRLDRGRSRRTEATALGFAGVVAHLRAST